MISKVKGTKGPGLLASSVVIVVALDLKPKFGRSKDSGKQGLKWKEKSAVTIAFRLQHGNIKPWV